MREQVEEFAAMGFNGHIPKPISFDELREKLRENLPEGTLLRDPKPAGPGAADFAVPGIAVDEGLARFGGKLDRYKSALLRFAKDDAPPPPLAADKEFHLYIHTQKGLTGNLGMNELSALSKAVERGVLDGAPDEEAYRVFRAELAALKARILSCADGGEPAEGVSRKTGGKERLKQELEALRDALWKGNATDAESLLASISGTVWEGVPPLDLGPLRAALDEYDFDEAVGCVKELMAAN
jgi:hypothetical protein